jgi:hypothetical protein
MPDFNVRADSVNVEQIMEQIRARIREKRGVDYTEEQLREIAAVKLEKFLDPRGVRSDLLEQFKRRQPTYEPPVTPSFTFEDTTLYETHRGVLRFIRRLLNPILKLLFNPNAINHALHTQAALNAVNLEREAARETQRRNIEALYYEVIHNLVFEMTRLGIDTKNVKMRVESIASRLEFNERRARALESVVAYRASSESETRDEPAPAPRQQPPISVAPGATPGVAPVAAPSIASSSGPGQAPSSSSGQPGPTAPDGPGQRSRRRRRRRGRRGGASAVSMMTSGPGQSSAAPAAPAAPSDQPAPAPESTAPGTDTEPQ